MTTAEQLAATRVGTVLGGRWTLERVVGVGGMAAVYAARAPDGSRAALKLLHPDSGLKPEIRERFLREGLAANRVDHPAAVRVLDQAGSEDGDDAYLVMELLEGESLAERCRREPLTPDELLDVLDQTLDVLAVAHACGIVHRDLKPDNLFLTRDGKIKVLDFGIARFLDAVPGDFKTRTGIAIGTLPYMAPEQALGKRDQIDGRTDLFALGAVAFRVLTGRRVHEADTEPALLVAMATQPVPPIASVMPEVPRFIAAIIDLALAFTPAARYPDARTMQSDVRAVRAGKPPPHATHLASARQDATRADRPAAAASAGPRVDADAPTAPAIAAPAERTAAPTLLSAAFPQRVEQPPAAAVDRAAFVVSRPIALALLCGALFLAAALIGLGVIVSRSIVPAGDAEPAAASASASPREREEAKREEAKRERERDKREDKLERERDKREREEEKRKRKP